MSMSGNHMFQLSDMSQTLHELGVRNGAVFSCAEHWETRKETSRRIFLDHSDNRPVRSRRCCCCSRRHAHSVDKQSSPAKVPHVIGKQIAKEEPQHRAFSVTVTTSSGQSVEACGLCPNDTLL